MQGSQDAQFLGGVFWKGRYLVAALRSVFMELVKGPEDLTSIAGSWPWPGLQSLLPM